jgi:hypothetical protein
MNDRRLDRRCPEGIQAASGRLPEAHNLVQLFIAVEDVSPSVSRARAVLGDPQGIPFRIYHRSGR